MKLDCRAPPFLGRKQRSSAATACCWPLGPVTARRPLAAGPCPLLLTPHPWTSALAANYGSVLRERRDSRAVDGRQDR
jgi:hypothetical protein